MRKLYATDASEYEELPAAVAFPESDEDVARLIAYARERRLGLIPRGAGPRSPARWSAAGSSWIWAGA